MKEAAKLRRPLCMIKLKALAQTKEIGQMRHAKVEKRAPQLRLAPVVAVSHRRRWSRRNRRQFGRQMGYRLGGRMVKDYRRKSCVFCHHVLLLTGAVRLSGLDADGDTPLYSREIGANPGVWEGVWM